MTSSNALPHSAGVWRRAEWRARRTHGRRVPGVRKAGAPASTCSSAGFAGAISGLLASDARGPARGRPAARSAPWGEASEGGQSPSPSFLDDIVLSERHVHQIPHDVVEGHVRLLD